MAEVTPDLLTAKPLDTSRRPWAKRAEELAAKEGPYADYAAWEEWITAQLESFYPVETCDRTLEAFQDMAIIERVAFYSLMCDLADKGA